MSKPVVEYVASEFNFIRVGAGAYVHALKHPGNAVYEGGTGEVRTSTVISYNEDNGNFETQNTLYKLVYSVAL